MKQSCVFYLLGLLQWRPWIFFHKIIYILCHTMGFYAVRFLYLMSGFYCTKIRKQIVWEILLHNMFSFHKDVEIGFNKAENQAMYWQFKQLRLKQIWCSSYWSVHLASLLHHCNIFKNIKCQRSTSQKSIERNISTLHNFNSFNMNIYLYSTCIKIIWVGFHKHSFLANVLRWVYWAWICIYCWLKKYHRKKEKIP